MVTPFRKTELSGVSRFASHAPPSSLYNAPANMFVFKMIPSEAPDKDAAYSFMDYIMQPEVAAKCTDYIGYYSTNKAADELVNPDLVVPDDVTKGEIVQNVSQDADAQYQKNWTEFKAACD